MPFVCAGWTLEEAVYGLTCSVGDNVIIMQSPCDRLTRGQPEELLKPGRKGLFSRLLERALVPGNDGVFDEHIYKYFVSVLS